MKLLCTADIHLKTDQPESLKTLEWLLDEAETREVDCVLIGGDLFDSMEDFRKLKGDVEQVFSGVGDSIEALMVSGNHDSEISSGDRLGEGLEILEPENSPFRVEGEVSLDAFGLPFKEGREAVDFLDNFRKDFSEGINLLLTHGSLIYPGREYILEGLRNQHEGESFPMFAEDLADLGFDTVVLGHWHGGDVFEVNGTNFIYPGSALPQSRKETGERSFVIVEVEPGEDPSFSREKIAFSENWYYLQEEIFLVPRGKDKILGKIEDLMEDKKDKRCHLLLDIDGFLAESSEGELRASAEEVFEEYGDDYYEIETNWNVVSESSLRNPLVERFIEEASEIQLDEELIPEILDELEYEIRPYFADILKDDSGKLRNMIMEYGLMVLSDRLER